MDLESIFELNKSSKIYPIPALIVKGPGLVSMQARAQLFEKVLENWGFHSAKTKGPSRLGIGSARDNFFRARTHHISI